MTVNTLKLTSLQRRAISAFVLAPVFIFTILYGSWPLLFWLLLSFGISIFEWHNLSHRTDRFGLYMTFGVVYFLLAHGAFYGLREVYSLNIVLLFIGMIWFSDIAGYFVGKFFGGPKLIIHVSPNKTWSGFGGALLFPGLFAVFWIMLFGFDVHFSGWPWYILYPIGFAIGVLMGSIGQAGDLLISYVKRQAAVKDTGALIPGHGGLLDRIDSMMLGAPVFFSLLMMLSYVL